MLITELTLTIIIGGNKKKKVLIIALLLICGIANAQNYLQLNITEIQNGEVLEYCMSQYDSIVIFRKESLM